MLIQLIQQLKADLFLCASLGYDPAKWAFVLNPHKYATSPDQEKNLVDLGRTLFIVEQALNVDIMNNITSGLRSIELQSKIDTAVGRALRLGSRHLYGLAADVSDPHHSIFDAVCDETDVQTALGVWLKDKGSTPTWCHLQIVPPASGKLVFIP